MNYTSFLIKALNDLIELNKDRVVSFLQADKGIDENDTFLKEACLQIIKDGQTNIKELSSQIKKIDNVASQLNKKNRKVDDLWKEIIGEDIKYSKYVQCFASCVCSEDAVQQVYEDTLLTYTFMPMELRTIIMQQKKKIGYIKNGIMDYLNYNPNRIRAIA